MQFSSNVTTMTIFLSKLFFTIFSHKKAPELFLVANCQEIAKVGEKVLI